MGLIKILNHIWTKPSKSLTDTFTNVEWQCDICKIFYHYSDSSNLKDQECPVRLREELNKYLNN